MTAERKSLHHAPVQEAQRELRIEFETWLKTNETLSAPFKATVFGYVWKLCENAAEIGRVQALSGTEE